MCALTVNCRQNGTPRAAFPTNATKNNRADNIRPYNMFMLSFAYCAVSDVQAAFLMIVSEFTSVNVAAVELAQLAGERNSPLQANG